jgi:predicted DNA-binding protein
LHRLYLLSEQAGRPMTKLLNEALEQFLFDQEATDERERLL